MLKSLEAVCQMLKTFNFPKKGTKIENDYFEVEVLESTPGLS